MFLLVRLVNGTNEYEGRVEILFHGEWGSVCMDYLDDPFLAAVICAQLGYSGGVKAFRGTFGMSSGPIWLNSEINCNGDESELALCPQDSYPAENVCWGCDRGCGHEDDLGVYCGKLGCDRGCVHEDDLGVYCV